MVVPGMLVNRQLSLFCQVLLAASLVVLSSCSQGRGFQQQQLDSLQDGSTTVATPGQATEDPSLPPFPLGGGVIASAVKRVGTSDLQIAGTSYIAESGSGNYEGVNHSYVIVPSGEEELAWATFALSDLTLDRPSEVSFQVAAAPIVPSGENELPLNYWVGIADYTTFCWQWHGPYSEPTALNVNTENIRDRYVSADAVMYFTVLTIADSQFQTPENPDGLTAAKIIASTIHAETSTESIYFPTKPHYPAIEEAAVGTAKGTAALDPSQYVTIHWEHVFDIENADLEALLYRLYRQGPMDSVMYPIGTVTAPAEEYTDPLDNQGDLDPVIPGATYNYYLRAFNPAGYTPFDRIPVTIPLLAPANIAVTKGTYTDRIELTWSSAEAAEGYLIYRDNLLSPYAETGLVEGYVDSQDIVPGQLHLYWISSKNQYMPDGGQISAPALGWAIHTPWPMFKHDFWHSGYSEFIGTQSSALKWSYPVGAEVSSSPAIGANGRIYFGSSDYSLYALEPDGDKAWSYATAGEIWSSPAIGVDGTIYVGSYDGSVYAVKPNGDLKWSYPTGGDAVFSSPSVGTDNIVYVGSAGPGLTEGTLCAINPDGTKKWHCAMSGLVWSSPAIGLDGTIYVGSDDGNVTAVSSAGSILWNYTTGDSIWSSPALGVDGTIYIGSWDNKLYAINPDGSFKWSYPTGGAISSSPAVGPGGTIYIGSDDGKLHAINPNGTFKWAYTTSNAVYSSPAVDNAGNVYFGSEDTNIYALEPAGSLLWNYGTGDSVLSSPAIAEDGTIYVGSKDGNLYAIGL